MGGVCRDSVVGGGPIACCRLARVGHCVHRCECICGGACSVRSAPVGDPRAYGDTHTCVCHYGRTGVSGSVTKIASVTARRGVWFSGSFVTRRAAPAGPPAGAALGVLVFTCWQVAGTVLVTQTLRHTVVSDWLYLLLMLLGSMVSLFLRLAIDYTSI
ncbi:hypothetical protein TPHA_0D01020 [Tetrapisispora phaffii CBS 4417]|uniref:Uncharacterized protein n=1 Tax=Tetrapisispora phaffii (strain ATCC 24235 / CBS 4417 / NBRC 1672 / NRRL Y-8282 / UCD 70-5) TaxID=1071381 RepID=G8BSC2_TETPH|nr:hypothetical protein TPHA_0D01020 [Tetrapisispora phaffii CBS 4417]CCE62743.1 hypothetical protein TPHA_0D01020 [Tetrapisispora phaffii CBS 4417]